VEQDLVHGGSILALLGVHFDWMDLFDLLGRADCAEEQRSRDRNSEFPREDQCEK
jgi:hypothetical protein